MSLLINGKEATVLVACKLSDYVFLYSESNQDRPDLFNIWNHSVKVIHHDPTHEPCSHMLQPISSHLLTTGILPASSLIPALPYLYKLVADKSSITMHVSASYADQSSSFANFAHVMAVRQTGVVLLCASTVQEAYDFSILAHWISILASKPVLHFFDSRRISDELNCIEQVDENQLTSWFNQDFVNQEIKNKSVPLPLDHTGNLSRKTSLLAKEESDILAIFKQVADQFSKHSGRAYDFLKYTGSLEAENVVIAMGAGATVAQETQSVFSEHSKIGVLKIHLYRPWSHTALLNALPSTVKRIAVLEPSDSLASTWAPLFLDIVAAYQSVNNDEIEIFSGQYSVEEDFSASQAEAIFNGLISNQLDRCFNVSSLPLQRVCPLDSLGDQIVFEGDLKLAKLFASHQIPSKQVQLYSVNNGGITHIRLAEPASRPLLPALIEQSDVVILAAKDDKNSLQATKSLKVNGIVVVQGDIDTIPACIKRMLHTKNAKIAAYTDLAIALNQIELRDLMEARIPFIDAPQTWSTESDFMPLNESIKPQPMVKTLPIELPYIKMLDQAFGSRLSIENAYFESSIWSPSTSHTNAAQPEFGYGRLLNHIQQRIRFSDLVTKTISEGSLPLEIIRILSHWLILVNSPKSNHAKIQQASDLVVNVLSSVNQQSPAVQNILMQKNLLYSRSHWLIGSDTWAHDLGQSGLHHVINSGEDVNLLIVDTTPYHSRENINQMKKNIGLYAMNCNSVYVASVALYSSYTGALQALVEADNFKGPSIVLAYLPQLSDSPDPILSMKETKICVDNGTWPLYRWNPDLAADGENEVFKLDSSCIKKDLENFLARENYLSQLVASHPDVFPTSNSLESDIKKRHNQLKIKAQHDYNRLLSGLASSNGSHVTILYGSDNGNAENCAKKLAVRSKARGLQVNLMSLDDYANVQDIANETNMVFVCSTAGQGEFPSNARKFWKSLNRLSFGDIELSELNFSVLGLGDSHYWPRKEDAGFYNKPAKLLDAKLEILGANRLLPIGLADDQDPDGYETVFESWQPELWKALGAREVASIDEPVYTDEQMKVDSNYLRGTISQGLVDNSTGNINEVDQKLLKFHGAYLQDDRDLRESRKEQGMEKAYSFLVRVRTPSGIATPKQWIAIDKIADKFGVGQLKLTTRQTFQIHGVLKKNLRSTIRAINKTLLSTLAACGDVNRNIMCTTLTEIPEVHDQVQETVSKLVELLAPKTSAYHEIWLNNSMVAGHAVQDFEPVYGPTYLPRKFKIAIAIPPRNDVDVFAHDIGYIAIVDTTSRQLVGYNVLIGGGMGQTYGNKRTYPRQGSVIGYLPAEKILEVTQAIVTIQRDFGDRLDRKRARFKYTVDDRGIESIKQEIERRCGLSLSDPKPYLFKDNVDPYGWSKGKGDTWNFCMFIENGRLKDTPDLQMKTGVRELAKFHKGEFRLTANQNLLIAGIPEHDLERTKAHLTKYKVDNLFFSTIRKTSMACVALPTCGLAMAESERYLPTLITLFEEIMEESGLLEDSIVVRMTGCPNGCSRPYLAEIALVGKAPGIYNMYLGGSATGNRLNKLYLENLDETMILNALRPIIKHYALERHEGEAFGNWVIRAGYVKQTLTGLDFHD